MPRSPLFLTVAAIVLLLLGAMTTQFIVHPPEGVSPATASPPASRQGAPVAIGTGPASVSAASMSTSLGAQEIPVQPGGGLPSGIVVTGEGRITVQPDIAQITLGVEVTNVSASAALQDAASQMGSVVSKLKQQGIADKDIRTVSYNLTPEYDYSNRSSPTLKDYRATNLVSVTVRDITKVGPVIDAVGGAGATRIQGISFSVSDPTAAANQGRDEAMKNAKAKADQLAKDAGVTLGPPISIQETGGTPSAPVPMAPAVAASGAVVQTPISPGTQEVQVSVTVVYSIK